MVKVDNGFSWSLWTQERLLINDEIAKSSSGWGRFFQKYSEPWLTPLGDGELTIALKSTSRHIRCVATLDAEPIEAEQILEASWRGAAGSWPEEAQWKPQDPKGGWAR